MSAEETLNVLNDVLIHFGVVDKYIYNCNTTPYYPGISREDLADSFSIYLLDMSFYFSLSPEGYDYWENIDDAFRSAFKKFEIYKKHNKDG